MTDIIYWIWLSNLINPGSRKSAQIIDLFKDPEKAYRATSDEMFALGATDDIVRLLSDKNTDEALRIYNYCKRNGVKVITFEDGCYPQRLRMIDNPPVLLYVMGELPDIDDNVCIAAVGTRLYTEYGGRAAYTISYDLASAGAVIISGLARGIDSICHRGCIDAFGKTVAVLGCGIDVVYPPENASLYAEIIRNGAVVTEYRPGTGPLGRNFPVRNRIISGLSLGTLVVEAKAKSGSLITADCAANQGRDLFALPGKVGDINSVGTNELIKKGAKMITSASDILEEYESLFPHRIRTEMIGGKTAAMRTPKVKTQISRVAETPETIVNDIEIISGPSGGAAHAIKKRSGDTGSPGTAEPAKTSAPDLSKLDGDSRDVYTALPDGRDAVPDDLAKDGMSISKVLSALTVLEINGLVKCLPGGKYRKT